MTVSWIVDQYMLDLSADRGCGSIADAIRNAGFEVHVASSVSPLKGSVDLPNWKGRPVVLYGSFRFVRQIERQMRGSGAEPCLPGAFANVANLSYSAFGSWLGDLMLNDDFVILPFAEFRRRGLASWGGRCFLRPNAVTKSFTGTVIDEEGFAAEVNALEKLQNVMPDDLVVAAAARAIKRETRFVIVDGEVVAGSTYGWNGNADIGHPLDEQSIALAREVASREWQPDRAYTCDVALTEIGGQTVARLVELNSFSCAGLYACDLDKVVRAVSAAAMDEWELSGMV